MADENVIQSEKFLMLANKTYEDNKKKWSTHLFERQMDWDEDVYSDTILKVYDYIQKNGIADDSEQGLLNYWFKAFMINIRREKQYSRNAYRDLNVDATEELDKEFNGDEELEEKKKRHIYDDWLVYNILLIVEKTFDSKSFYCFRLYYLYPKMTYEKLKELTKIKDCKKRVITIKKWLQENLDKGKLMEQFNKYYYDDGN